MILHGKNILAFIRTFSLQNSNVCYGSVFGYENHDFLKPLWLSPLKQDDIGKLLATAVGVGVIFSSVAIIINIINHFRAKRFFDGIFDRFGLLGLVFFWMVLGTGLWPMTRCGITRLWRRASPMAFGRKLCSLAYCWMAFRRSSLIRGESFSARETVATEIPNSLAISFIVMGTFSSIGF